MAKHKYIETPERLWEMFEEYKESLRQNPWHKIEYVGRDGERVETPVIMPMTIEGFKTFCAKDTEEHATLQHYWNNSNNAYENYRTIVARIKEEIRSQQITGALTGFFNPNLTARINAITEKTENEHKIESNQIQISIKDFTK